jgi:glycine/D-amino acid oxidase-like deaminating enzyme/nitrite reductase/ring-hydroxylating ferredoxin subunit
MGFLSRRRRCKRLARTARRIQGAVFAAGGARMRAGLTRHPPAPEAHCHARPNRVTAETAGMPAAHGQAAMRHPPNHHGNTTSLWMDVDLPATAPLPSSRSTEIAVIGAGIAGLSVAYELSRRGHGVAVIDAAEIGGGQTGRTSAHLASALDDRFYQLEKVHGERGAELAAQSHRAAIDRIEAIAAAEGIRCDFERMDGYLFLAPGHDPEMIELEYRAALRSGVPVESLSTPPLSFATGPCLRFPQQAQFHPMKYLSGLARSVLGSGGQIYTHTHADSIKSGTPSVIHTRHGPLIRADVVVVATNVPVNDRTVIHTKQAPYRTYVIAAPVNPSEMMRALYWDTGDPYHYVRMATIGGRDYLLVGGEDHKTGQEEHPENRWSALEQWTRSRFPFIEQVEARWSGQVIEPVDSLAFIGKNPLDAGRVYIATGDSGHGLTHGAIAGMLLADEIEGRTSPWSALYDPRRRALRAAGEFAKENFNTFTQYADWLKKGDLPSVDDVQPGTGAVLRNGLQLVATYVDDDGVVHACSAVCPHLAGIVRWNSAESTWDCPCHGSRFDRYGRVIEGPAIKSLEPYPALKLRKPKAASPRVPNPRPSGR